MSTNVSTSFHWTQQTLLCCADISALSDQCCQSLCEQLASVLALLACRSEVNQVAEWAYMPVHLSWPSPVFSAKHVNGQLFGLKVLYLSSSPRQPAVMLPGLTLFKQLLSCLTCLALKDDHPTHPPPAPLLQLKLVCPCQHTTSEQWTDSCGWEVGGEVEEGQKCVFGTRWKSPFCRTSLLLLRAG